MSDKAWHISYLSAIVGPCAATTDDGCMAWEDEEKVTLLCAYLTGITTPKTSYSLFNQK